jgi:hypothetical protein
MTDYWFKPKTHGYGATPTNWKGWAATGAYALVVAALSLFLLVPPPGQEVRAPHAFLWLGLVMVVTYAFLRFSKARTDGEWRWRWGE